MSETNRPSAFMEFVRNSHLLRIMYLSVLAAVLLIPIGMVDKVITERQGRREEAVRDVVSKWGDRQSVVGPMLIIPYMEEITETADDGTKEVRNETRYACFLPETIRTVGKIGCETRYRGIYTIPVYSSDLDVSGVFSFPDFSGLGVKAKDVVWDRAYLTMRISDARAITNPVAVNWNNQDLPFLPGVGELGARKPGSMFR